MTHGVALLTLGSSNIPGITYYAYHLCLSNFAAAEDPPASSRNIGRSPICRQLQSAPNLLSDWQVLQPCCTYLGRNHIILKNQVVCKVSLQSHGDGVESAGKGIGKLMPRGQDKAHTQHVSQAQWQHPWGIWRQEQDSIPASPFPAISPDFSLPATNLHQSPGNMLTLPRIGVEAGLGGYGLASVSP